MCRSRRGHGRAEVAGGVSDEEGAFRGCEGGGGNNEVALILARRGIEDDEEVACGLG